MANALTSDAVVAQYFDLYVGGDKFTEDFTNAVMTNMGIEFKPSSDYSVLTMGYDKYGIACASSRVDFSTPAANIIGNPTVTYKVLEANYEDFTIDFQPNEDCLGFYACAFEKGTAKAQYEQWGAMMGFANMGDMIKQWGGTMFADRETHTWKQMTPEHRLRGLCPPRSMRTKTMARWSSCPSRPRSMVVRARLRSRSRWVSLVAIRQVLPVCHLHAQRPGFLHARHDHRQGRLPVFRRLGYG